MVGEGAPAWRRRIGRADPLFRHMADGDLKALAKVTTWWAYGRGAFIVQPGDEPGHVFVLARGTARVFASAPDGRELDILLLSTGDVIDFNDLPPPLDEYIYAEATGEDTLAFELPREAFHGAVFARPSAAAALDLQRGEVNPIFRTTASSH